MDALPSVAAMAIWGHDEKRSVFSLVTEHVAAAEDKSEVRMNDGHLARVPPFRDKMALSFVRA